MAALVAAFGTSHSPMLAGEADEWRDSFLPRDRARAHFDLDGRPCRYDDLLAAAPADALDRIAPEVLRQRHAGQQHRAGQAKHCPSHPHSPQSLGGSFPPARGRRQASCGLRRAGRPGRATALSVHTESV